MSYDETKRCEDPPVRATYSNPWQASYRETVVAYNIMPEVRPPNRSWKMPKWTEDFASGVAAAAAAAAVAAAVTGHLAVGYVRTSRD